MADISKLTRLVGGAIKSIDLASNTLVVDRVKVGGGAGTDLTKTILDNLVTLQNGGTGGAGLVGVSGTPTNYTPTAATVQGHLEGIDSALATAGADEFGDDVFRITDDGDATKKIAFQASGLTTATTRTITMPDADVNLGSLTNGNISAGAGIVYSKLMLSASIINNDISASAAIAYSKLNLASSIVNADISASAAIAYSKLSLASSIVNADISASASIDYSKLALTSSIVNADISASAAIAESKLALDYSTSSLNTAVGTKVSKSGDTLTGYLTLHADPTSAMHPATKQYVDLSLQGVKPKQAVRVATTADITLSGTQTIDGVSVSVGDRVLVKDQSIATTNGIYVVSASAWSRATDFDSISPIDEINGSWVGVQQGTANAGKVFIQYGLVSTIGADAVSFTYFSDLSTLIGGDMVTVSGSTVTLDLLSTGGLESTNPGNAAGQLRTKLNAAGAIVSDGSGLAVNLETSDPGLAISSNKLDVKRDAAGAIGTGASGIKVNLEASNPSLQISSNELGLKIDSDGALEKTSAGVRVKLNTDSRLNRVSGGLSVTSAPKADKVAGSKTAGEGFAASTSFVVRWAVNGETDGRIYKADQDATSVEKYHTIGLVAGNSQAAADPIEVVSMGEFSHTDTTFAGTDIGKPVFLTSAGGWSLTAPTTTNYAVVRIGFVASTTSIWIQPQEIGIN